MKEQKFGPMPVLALTAAAGLMGFFLRRAMLSLGYDALGVQISGHWTYICLWVLSALTLGCLFFLCRGMGDRSSMEDNLKPSLLSGICGILAGVLLLVCCLMGLLEQPGTLDMVVCAVGLAAGLCMALGGWLRISGQANGPAGLVITVFLAMWLIRHFRAWSSDPLLGDYCFRLLAVICSMIASLQLAGFPLGMGKRRACMFYSMAAVFFCCISLADGGAQNLLFYGSMGLWLLTGSCTLTRPRRRRKLGGGFVEEA